jgi:hypothetical protein
MIKNVRLLFGSLTFLLYISTVNEKESYESQRKKRTKNPT